MAKKTAKTKKTAKAKKVGKYQVKDMPKFCICTQRGLIVGHARTRPEAVKMASNLEKQDERLEKEIPQAASDNAEGDPNLSRKAPA